MSEEHVHGDATHSHADEPKPRMRYAITFSDRNALGGLDKPLVVEGVGTSKEGNELLIDTGNGGGYVNINYDRIRFYTASPL